MPDRKTLIVLCLPVWFLFHACNSEPAVYSCADAATLECPDPSEQNSPSEPLQQLRQNAIGTWKLYSTRSVDPAWKTDSTYSSVYMRVIPELCLGADGLIVDKNGRKGKECTYCYSIVQSPTSQDTFLIQVGSYEPMGCVPVFNSGQHIACLGDTLFLQNREDRFIFYQKYTRVK